MGGRRWGRECGGSGNWDGLFVERVGEREGEDVGFGLVGGGERGVDEGWGGGGFVGGRSEGGIGEEGSEWGGVV